jgi:hypothetical protein
VKAPVAAAVGVWDEGLLRRWRDAAAVEGVVFGAAAAAATSGRPRWVGIETFDESGNRELAAPVDGLVSADPIERIGVEVEVWVVVRGAPITGLLRRGTSPAAALVEQAGHGSDA